MRGKSGFVLISIIVALVMLFSACQPQTVVKTVEVEKTVVVEKVVEIEAEKELDQEEMAKEFLRGKKICVLFSGVVNDAGWTANGYNGLINLRDNYGMEFSYRESVLVEEAADLMRDFASSGCDIIFAHGFQYADQIDQVAAEHPEIQFAETSRGFGKPPNVIGLTLITGETGYFASRIAGHKTKTGKIAIVAGQIFPSFDWSIRQARVAATDMAKAGFVDKPYTVELLEVGSWTDPAKAKELTAAGIEAGIDVFIMNSDASDAGILEAIKAARSQGKEIWGISGVGDKNYLGPDFMIGGWEERVTNMMKLMALAYASAGGPTYADLPSGIREGTIVFAPSYGLLSDKAEEDIVATMQCYIKKGLECEMIGDDFEITGEL